MDVKAKRVRVKKKHNKYRLFEVREIIFEVQFLACEFLATFTCS